MLLEGSQWKGEVPTQPKNTKETEKLLCTVPEPTVVWRHIVLYPLLKPESVMVAIIMTILIRRERSTNEELRTEKLKARPRHAHTVRSLGAS